MRRDCRLAAGHFGRVLFAIHTAVDLDNVMIGEFLNIYLGSASRIGQPKQGGTRGNSNTYN